MPLLRVYLFGAPRLEQDGENILIQRRKAVALFAYLAVSGQPHSRDALATLLWPEYEQSSARSSLRRDLSRLKGSVGEDVLLIDRMQVSVNPEAALWVDVAEFERRVTTVQQHDHAPQQLCPDCLAALSEAVALYTGDFLAGFHLLDSPEFDEWQFFQREGLQQSLAEALQRLIGWYVSQQAFERGVEYGRRWLALDPLHEPAHRQLMRLYGWAGQQAAALRQYEECVRLLKEELGVEPEAETVALYEVIRTRQLEMPEGEQGSRGAGERRSGGASGRAGELVMAGGGLPPEKRYAVEELMTSGGHGEVYRGLDRVTGQPVVIKRLKPELVQREPQFVTRFIREGEALRQLNHPNIVQMLATFEVDGQHSIVMEYVPGGSLRQMLEETPQLPLERALDIALELADALSRAHHLNVIHRDIKPDNVLLAADGTPRLTDFGIARLGGDDARLTQTGNFIGSPAYMSPEALRGEELDARSDIWSFGVLLYEMLAGRRPFAGEQLTPVLVGILNEPVPEISHLRPEVPPALADLLAQLLVKERDQRIPSVRLVAAELEAIRSGRPRGYETPAGRLPGGGVSAWGEQSTPQSTSTRRKLEQRIQICTSSDGAHIAYATVGEGPPLLKVANWLTHLEYDWESPVWRHWLAALSRNHTLVRYDKRGCGLSDWDVTDFSLNAHVADLEAVVDALGLKRFALLGLSGGGPIAIAYAARHPEKVSHLILYGSYARGRLKRSQGPGQIQEAQMLLEVMKLGWGKANPAFRQVYTSLFIPGGTAEQVEWFNDLQRISTSPEVAVRMFEATFSRDVRDVASKLAIPTLVLHARDDAVVPFEEGRQLAALIPGARFVPLQGKNHILLEDEPAWQRFLEEVFHFLKDAPGTTVPSHVELSTPAAALTTPAGDVAGGELPRQATPFIGRQQELADIQRILLDEPDCRLLTLVGPGGIGKTRLALEAASQVRQSFPDGVFFVPLAPLASAEHIVSTVAEHVYLHFYDAADPRQQLLNYLRQKKVLLVMDNFEHVLEGATLVSEILHSAARVVILATSRESLNLSSESVYTLSGLSFPSDETVVASEEAYYSAVELLLEHARRLHPDFKPGAEALRLAARIARLVQGMPLAIVLATHWLDILSLADIADEIAGSLDILETEMRDVPLRQRSVRAVFDSSWKRLSASEQAVFMRLAVFRGGFTRRAAQQVAGAGLRTLRTLVNKSLIVAGREGRFELHELLRQYGDEKLVASGEMDKVRTAHSAYYLSALQEWEADLKGQRQIEALSEIEVDSKNIHAAWSFALQRRDHEGINQALECIHLFCDMRGRYQEGIELFARAREQLAPTSRSEPEPIWGRIITRYGFLQVMVPASREKVTAELEQGLAIAQKYNDQAEMGLALQALGTHNNLALQDPARGLAYLQQGLEIFRRLDDHFYVGRALFGIGLCYAILSDLARFSHFTQEGLAIARGHGNKVDTAVALGNLAEVAFGRGEYTAAENYSREAVAIAREINSPPAVAYSRAWLGFAYLLRGDMNAAGAIIKKSLASAQNISHEIVVAYATGMLSLWASLSGDYETGRQYGEESRANPANNTLGPILARWGLVVAYEGMQHVEAAWNTLVDALAQTRSLAFPAPPLWLLPVAAVLLARRGEKARAVEVLALSSHHPLSPTGWMEQWTLLAQVRADLEKQLGGEAYKSAWEHGQTLDLEFVVSSLLAETNPEQAEVARNLPAQSTPFVGREREYSELKELIEATRSGQGHVALIEGEPGVGKSRLVQEALDYARWQGVSALAVKCYEAEQEMLYEVVMELVTQALAGWPAATFAQVPRLSLAEIALLVPEVATHFPGLPTVTTGFDEARQARLFRALAQFLSAPAAANGFILVVDDIQWADPVTRQFLHHMAHHIAGQPILLILVYRSAEAAADEQLVTMIHTWQRQAHVSHLSLERLSAEDTATLVAAVLTSAPYAQELGQWLYRESDGNPFFLVSILQSLQERDLLAEGNGQEWQKDIEAIRQSAAELTLPDALRQLVRDRLRRLPGPVRQLLDVAAVLGGRFDLQTLQAVLGKDRLSLLEGVEQLLARRLLREEESGHRYDFSHDKIREVVYHDLSATRRRLLHCHIAEAVESLDASRVGMLAEHYEQGEVWDKAITYLARTAGRSRQLFAVREALRFYDRALALAIAHPDAVGKGFVADLYEQRGEARAHAGEFEAAADDLQAALAAAPADDAGRIRDLHVKLGMTYRRNDRLDTAIGHLEAALEAARSSGDDRSVADALYHLGTAVWSRGDNHQARVYHEEAVAICRRLELKELVAIQALHGLGEVRWQAGHPAESLGLSAESLDMARRIGDRSYEAENLTNMALVLQGAIGLADYRRAETLLLEALAISREAGLEWHRLTALAELAGNYSLLGDYRPALATMQEALELAESLGSQRLRSFALDVRGTIWQELNQLERAAEDHAAGVRVAEESGNGFWLPRLQANLAIDRLRRGDLSVGEGLQVVLEEALARELEGHAVRCLEGLAEWALAKGEPQEALGYVAQLHDLAEAGGMREVVAQAMRWRGEARLALGQWEAAAADLQQALALGEELGRPRLVWDVHAALAQLHRAQGEGEPADNHEAQVRVIAERIAGSLPDGLLQEPLLPENGD